MTSHISLLPSTKLYCNQRELGEPLFEQLQEFMHDPYYVGLYDFLKDGPEGIARLSCAIASAMTAINVCLQRPALDSTKIALITRELLVNHRGVKVMNTDGEKDWQVFGGSGFRYHTMAVIARAFGLDSKVFNWHPSQDSRPLMPYELWLKLIVAGAVSSISLNNRYVNEVTKAAYTMSDRVGHIVTVVRVIDHSQADPQAWLLEVADPVADRAGPPTVAVRAGLLLRYSTAGPNSVRGVLYARRPGLLDQVEPYHPYNVHYPPSIIKGLEKYILQLDRL